MPESAIDELLAILHFDADEILRRGKAGLFADGREHTLFVLLNERESRPEWCEKAARLLLQAIRRGQARRDAIAHEAAEAKRAAEGN